MSDVLLQLIGSILVWFLLAAGGALMLAAYFLPTIIVLFRRNQCMVAAVVILNLVVGWTFLGWLIALVLSLVTRSSSYQHYYYAYPQAPPYQPVSTISAYPPGYASANGSSPEAPAVAAPSSEDA